MPKTELSKRLQGLRPESVLFATDMTGSVLDQKAEGFPEDVRQNIRSLLDQGLAFVLISGDSLATVTEHFVKALAYSGPTPYYIIPGAGYQVLEVKAGDLRNIHTGRQFSRGELFEALNILESEIKSFLHPDFEFSEQELEAFTSGEGSRININSRIPGYEEIIYVECIPNKVTIFFPDSFVATGSPSQLLDSYSEHSNLKQLKEKADCHLIRGPNYVDVITTVKSDGIEALLNLPEGKALDPEKRAWIKAGDSPNDREIYTFPTQSPEGDLSIYYGSDSEFFGELAGIEDCGQTYFLKGEHHKGGAFVIKQLVKKV